MLLPPLTPPSLFRQFPHKHDLLGRLGVCSTLVPAVCDTTYSCALFPSYGGFHLHQE
jgi:hypothetical protein